MKRESGAVKEAARPPDANPLRIVPHMIGMGMRRDIAVVLAEMAGTKLSADDRKFLMGPLVIHKGPWSDTLPEWLPAQAFAERAEIVLGLRPEWIVGPSEMCAVMYPATMQTGFVRDLVDLYVWAGAAACSKHYRTPIGDQWAKLDMTPILDADVLKPGGRLHHDYAQLAREIRRSVMNHAPRWKPDAATRREALDTIAPAPAPAPAAQEDKPMAEIRLTEPTSMKTGLDRDQMHELFDLVRKGAADTFEHQLEYWRTHEALRDQNGWWSAMKCNHCHAKLLYRFGHGSDPDNALKWEDRIIAPCSKLKVK